MKRKREYCVKAVLNSEYIMYIGYVFGSYKVFVTNENHTHNYCVYGGYKNIGTAANRLLESARSYHSNPVKYLYMTRECLQDKGVFDNREEVR